MKSTLNSRGYLAVYPRERIDRYFKNNDCPENDRLCQEAGWFTQNMLLGTRSDMDQIAEAMMKGHPARCEQLIARWVGDAARYAPSRGGGLRERGLRFAEGLVD